MYNETRGLVNSTVRFVKNMDNVILVLLIIGVIGFFFGMTKIRYLLATGEVNNFNIMSATNLSQKAQSLKKQAISGFAVFGVSILGMLVIVSIYGPIKG